MTWPGRRHRWRLYLAARRGPFWSVEPLDQPNWIERAWIRVFG